MSPSRFAKSLLRSLRVTWREQPTQYDIEALEENVRRVGLVIRFRWTLVGALAVFSLAAALIYGADPSISDATLLANMRIPAAALLFVLGYNTYYQMTYRYLGNVAILNHAQLMFDALVITVLVHYSGGVYSWFYTIYALIVVEAAFIFSRRRDTWLVTGVAALAYAIVVWGEYLGWLPHVTPPLVGGGLEHNVSYVAVRYLWAIALLAGSALISMAMMERVRQREAELAASSTVDEATGLVNRVGFRQRLSGELQRARCYGTTVAVLVLDVDEFGAFNKRFGIESGNRVLRAVAELLQHDAWECGDSGIAELNTVARYGGEEFGIVVPSVPGRSAEDAELEAERLAERLRIDIGALRVDDMGVTVSVGLAMFPRDGLTASDLLASADQAVFSAASAGGNRVGTSDGERLGRPELAL